MFMFAQASETDGSGFVSLLGVFVLFVLYWLPTVIALYRKHHNKWAILVLNLLLGWTVLGWIAALVWSFTSVQTQRVQ